MPDVHVVTVPRGVPSCLRDRLLTAVAEVLEEAGAERVWVDRSHADVVVIAELGCAPPGDGPCPSEE